MIPNAESLTNSLALLPPEDIVRAIQETLSDAEADALLYDWEFWARPSQRVPVGDWLFWLSLAGRGWGKTRVGAETVRHFVQRGYRRVALVAPTAGDARDVMVEGESGLLAIYPESQRPKYEPSKRRITWPNGAVGMLYSADEPERLRGPQHDLAWADEIGSWRYQQESWDMLMFGLRLGQHPRCVITTTPRPLPVIRDLLGDPKTVVTRGSTYENRANLAPAFFGQIVRKYEGTRLGRQEIHAELLTDVPGALWNTTMLDACRVAHTPTLVRIVVAIDPSVTSNEESDECGIVVAGIDRAGHGHLLEDCSCTDTPDGWARVAVSAYHHWRADRIVAEVNNGGDLVEAVLRTVDPNIAYRAVRASRGKIRRAEPVAALYEQGRVHHVGNFGLLESQLCLLTPDNQYVKSPDRADALVWAFTDLMVAEEQPRVYGEFRDTIHLIDPAAIPARLSRYMAVLPQATGPHAMVWLGVDKWGDMYAYRELCVANCAEAFTAKDHAEAIAALEGAEQIWRREGQATEGATIRPGAERIIQRSLALVPDAEAWRQRYARYGVALVESSTRADVADDAIREMLRVRTVESRGGDWPRLHVSTECPGVAAEMASLRAEPRAPGDTEPRLVECLRAIAGLALRHSYTTESGR